MAGSIRFCLKLHNVSFSLIDDPLDHLDHSGIVRQPFDLSKLLNAAVNVVDYVCHGDAR